MNVADGTRMRPQLPDRHADRGGAGHSLGGRFGRRGGVRRALQREDARLANVLKSLGVRKGDFGASPAGVPKQPAVAAGSGGRGVFSGSRRRRWPADGLPLAGPDHRARLRAGRHVPLKQNADAALQSLPFVEHVLVLRRTGRDVPMTAGRDRWYDEALAEVSDECAPVEVSAEDPLFVLYTSGSTGKPKGVLHTTGGYLVHAAAAAGRCSTTIPATCISAPRMSAG